MSIIFSQHPGCRERHLLRKYRNPLFPPDRTDFDQTRVDGARYMDEQDVEKFEKSFHQLVHEIAGLNANEDSEKILLLKERLDQCFEQCCGLGGDYDKEKQAIRHLVGVIMEAVRLGAEGDSKAIQNLQEEELARQMHYQLLSTPLVADLLNPQSPIAHDELAATLLSESDDAVSAALQIFDPGQLQVIASDIKQLLNEKKLQAPILADVLKRLRLIEAACSQT